MRIWDKMTGTVLCLCWPSRAVQEGLRLHVINLCVLLSAQPEVSFLCIVTNLLLLEGFASNANLLRREV